MRYVAGSDHAGLRLKLELIEHLRERGVDVLDVGTFTTESSDYPLYAQKVAEGVTSGQAERGLLVCGTGIGVSIAANKVPGIRAAVVSDPFSARMAVLHNNAQILCLGERVVGPGLARLILDTFHDTQFEGGRHQRRLDLITHLEGEVRRGNQNEP